MAPIRTTLILTFLVSLLACESGQTCTSKSVVALVGGEHITGSEVSRMRAFMLFEGKKVSHGEALKAVIDAEMLRQEYSLPAESTRTRSRFEAIRRFRDSLLREYDEYDQRRATGGSTIDANPEQRASHLLSELAKKYAVQHTECGHQLLLRQD